MSWRENGKIYMRYYHLYKKEKLIKIMETLDFAMSFSKNLFSAQALCSILKRSLRDDMRELFVVPVLWGS